MSDIFTGEYMYWVGLNTPADSSESEIEEFNDFYDTVHVPEVLAANDGMIAVNRFELARPDPRGDFGPRWLAAYQLKDEASAEGYIRRNAPDAPDRPIYTSGPTAWQGMSRMWRMVWRRTVSLAGEQGGPASMMSAAPASMMMIGMSAAAGATAAQVDDFNQFYNDVHLGEVLQWGPFSRANRFALHSDLLHPEPGAPDYCAIYEAPGPDVWAPTAAGQFSSGPEAWEGRDTRWRLTYRML